MIFEKTIKIISFFKKIFNIEKTYHGDSLNVPMFYEVD